MYIFINYNMKLLETNFLNPSFASGGACHLFRLCDSRTLIIILIDRLSCLVSFKNP